MNDTNELRIRIFPKYSNKGSIVLNKRDSDCKLLSKSREMISMATKEEEDCYQNSKDSVMSNSSDLTANQISDPFNITRDSENEFPAQNSTSDSLQCETLTTDRINGRYSCYSNTEKKNSAKINSHFGRKSPNLNTKKVSYSPNEVCKYKNTVLSSNVSDKSSGSTNVATELDYDLSSKPVSRSECFSLLKTEQTELIHIDKQLDKNRELDNKLHVDFETSERPRIQRKRAATLSAVRSENIRVRVRRLSVDLDKSMHHHGSASLEKEAELHRKTKVERPHGFFPNSINHRMSFATHKNNSFMKGRKSTIVLSDPEPAQPFVKSSGQKCVDCWTKFLGFLFSTVGLTLLLVGYTVLGGFMFKYLEESFEQEIHRNMENTRRKYAAKLWNLTEALNVLYPDRWAEIAEKLLTNYTTEVYLATKTLGWGGQESNQTQWSFPGAMLYSITVITTIGYGHITPKTGTGRVLTIIYAIVGIPLTLLTITHLGGFMASSFRFFYKNTCAVARHLRHVCCSRWVKRRRREDRKFCKQSQDKTHDGFLSDVEVDCLTPLYSPVEYDGEKRDNLTLLFKLEMLFQSACADLDKVRVPAYVLLLVIFLYIALGAVMFSTWEKENNWDFLIGGYFCFITLSTIGFGDYVPGASVDSGAAHEKLVVCALYLLVGLALIAMCFDLIQEEARQTVKTIAKKIGLAE